MAMFVITRWYSISWLNPRFQKKGHFQQLAMYVYVYQRVHPINIPLNHYKIPLNHYKIPLNHCKIPLNHYKIPLNHYKIPSNHYKIPLNHYKPSMISASFKWCSHKIQSSTIASWDATTVSRPAARPADVDRGVFKCAIFIAMARIFLGMICVFLCYISYNLSTI